MMAISQLIEQTIAQHIANPRVISYVGTKRDEVQGRFIAANRVYNFVLDRKGVSYSPAGRQDSLVFSALFLERMDAVKRPKIGNDKCNAGKSYQCGKTCISNSWNCRKGVKDVSDARRIASILASTNERLKASVKVSDKAQARGRALFEARQKRGEKPKSKQEVLKPFVADYHDKAKAKALTKILSELDKKNIPAIYSDNSDKIFALSKDGKNVSAYKMADGEYVKDPTLTPSLIGWDVYVSREYDAGQKYGAHNNAAKDWIAAQKSEREAGLKQQQQQKAEEENKRKAIKDARDAVFEQINSIQLKGKKDVVKIPLNGDDGSVDYVDIKSTVYPNGLAVHKGLTKIGKYGDFYTVSQASTGLSLGLLKLSTLEEAKQVVKAMQKYGIDFNQDISKNKEELKKANDVLRFFKDENVTAIGSGSK